MFARTSNGDARAGFALPMALLALALITATIVASHSATSAETVANNAMRAQDRAYQMAEAGLQQFMARRGESNFCSNCAYDPAQADSEWTKVNLPTGYADVVSTRFRAAQSDGTPALFFIRSTGVDTTVRLPGTAGAVYATRTVGIYATWGTPGMRALGAFTSLNGLTNDTRLGGSNIAINGNDACGGTNVAGVVVARGKQYGGTNKPPVGAPGLDSTRTLDSLKAQIGIDWNAIKNLDAIPADYTVPPDKWPSGFTFALQWPIVRLKGNATLPNDGRGILIVEGDLTVAGNDDWDGILLVGGRLLTDGNGTFTGAIITGLNRLLPGAAPDNGAADNDQNDDRNKFEYNSCYVQYAAERLSRYFALTNTWMDNVATW